MRARTRIALALIAPVALLALAGCEAAPPTAGVSASASASPSPSDSPATGEQPTLPLENLTFEAGNSLPADSLPQFGENLSGNTDWQVSSPDDGTGSWAYTSSDGLCQALFSQHRLDESVPTIADDDRATTDALLKHLLKLSPEELATGVIDGTVGYGELGNGSTTDVRAVAASNPDSGQWLMAARAFAAAGIGLSVDLACKPGADSPQVFGEVLAGTTVVVPPAPAG
ncbi:hypothetical protein [Homoserinimonas sp. OAct 916]|uniref:hypothetical protein n=1 Tax=Homoserinimonas sp. OAct 916 TaxID=2211450 RepID=UPI000DBEA23D|nr:hypothetical protein [Homoserinimonas sp. OAct 916]